MTRHSQKKKPITTGNQDKNKEVGHVSTAASSRSEEQPRPEYPLDAGRIIVEQNEEMQRQDEQLVDLEASVVNLREASLSINQEITLQNRLLEDVHVQVDRVQGRQEGTQERLRNYIRRSGTCKLWMTVIGLAILLVLIIVVFK
jgi:hypothetical protein